MRIVDWLGSIAQNNFYMLEASFSNIGKPISKHCDICGWSGKYFKSFYNHRTRMKESTVCPKCGSVDRTRFTYEYLKRKPNRYYDILDVGVGEVKIIKKALPEAHQMSIDIVDNGATHIMSLTDLKVNDNLFDIIICLAILQEIEDETNALKEMYRVLRPDGEVLIYVPLGYYKDPQGLKATEYDAKLYKDTRGSSRIYEKYDFTRKLQAVGFKADYLQFEINGGYKQDNILFKGTK